MRMTHQLLTMAIMAAIDPRFGPDADRRSYHRPSVNRRPTPVYDRATYRRGDHGWDVVKAEALQAARRDRKRREWIRQRKHLGLMAAR
jgi:hypothetical protein